MKSRIAISLLSMTSIVLVILFSSVPDRTLLSGDFDGKVNSSLASSQPAQPFSEQLIPENVFSLDRFEPIFALSNVDSNLAASILVDLESLLTGSEFSQAFFPDGPQVFINDQAHLVKSALTYSALGRDGYSRPLLLEVDDFDEALRFIVVIDGRERLFLSQRLIELYERQLELVTSRPEVLEDLNRFVSELDALDGSIPEIDILNRIFNAPSLDEATIASNQEAQKLIKRNLEIYVGSYRQLGLLNIVPRSENEERFSRLPVETEFLANLVFKADNPGNIGYTRRSVFPVEYSSGQWRFFRY